MQTIHKYAESASTLDPSRSVFVSANAGSGKTSFLTSRVLALLMHGVSPGKILCLTYTNAAANEMISRIIGTLGSWVMMDEEALKEALSKLISTPMHRDVIARARGLFAEVLEAPVGLRLQTIHGFCQSLLARFPLEAGVGTHLSVMDGNTQLSLLKEARMQLFTHAKDPDSEYGAALFTLVQQLGEHNLLGLLDEMVKQRRKFLRFTEGAGGAVFAKKHIYKTFDIADNANFAGLISAQVKRDDAHIAMLRGIAAVLATTSQKTNLHTLDLLSRWCALNSPTPAECERYMAAYFVKTGERKGEGRQLFTKKTLSPEQEEYLLAEQQRMANLRDQWAALKDAEFTANLFSIGAKLIEYYDVLKTSHGLMDYDDQIIAATRLLSQASMASWVMFKLDGGIDHVLVDEAQDTSPEQWEIVRALTDEFFAGQGRSTQDRSIFVVGDEKQSIFRFQGADPLGLAINRRYFMQRLHDAAMPGETVALTHSWRSAPEILSLVDAVFASNTARRGLSAEGDPVRHQAKRESAKGYAELWPLAEASPERHLGADGVLARQVADEIAAWIKRDLQPGDIMVLVQRRKRFIYQLSRALKRLKVPVAGVDRMSLLDNLAVQDLMAFAQVLLFPEDDLTLAALLKSPLFNISEEKIFALAHGREKSLWQRLGDDPACAEAYALLADFRAKVDFVSPFAIFAELLDARGYRRFITGRMGEEYDEVLDIFLEQALQFESSATPSMQGFIAWLQAGEGEIKRDMEHAGGLVRIMTVHGSKGLQAKMVIVADTTATPPHGGSLQWHEGKPVLCADSAMPSAVYKAAKTNEREMEMEQYHRLLYVALTRAEDMLIVCGAKYGNAKSGMQSGSWYELVQPAFAQLGKPLENGRIAIGDPLITAQEKKQALPEANIYPLFGAAPSEQDPPRPLLPSQIVATDPAATSPKDGGVHIEKGVATHRILQYLPSIAQKDAWPHIAKSLAETYAPNIAGAMRDTLVSQALAVLSSLDYAPIFGPDSLAEVPVSGMIAWKGRKVRVLGQIDRVVVTPKEVWIIDYKSSAKPPENTTRQPVAYLHQMALYVAVLKEIYPGRAIRAGLLWTAVPRLDWLDSQLLDEAPASAYI